MVLAFHSSHTFFLCNCILHSLQKWWRRGFSGVFQIQLQLYFMFSILQTHRACTSSVQHPIDWQCSLRVSQVISWTWKLPLRVCPVSIFDWPSSWFLTRTVNGHFLTVNLKPRWQCFWQGNLISCAGNRQWWRDLSAAMAVGHSQDSSLECAFQREGCN